MNRGGLLRGAPWILLVLAVVLLGLVGQNRRNEGDPLDPRGTGPLGARALVMLLEGYDAEVLLTAATPAPGATALLLQDRLSTTQRRELEQWVRAGGTLVLADPLSSFAPPLERNATGLFGSPSGDEAGVLRPRCALAAVGGVDRIEVPGAAGYRLRDGAIGCFPVGSAFFLSARALGDGVVVALGGAGPFVNQQLPKRDNALLAVTLLAPRPAATVSILEAADPGTGERSLGSLVSRRVKDGLWQLLVAFALFALWRARRLGRPVLEHQPVEIAGSELVVAVGNLLQQARRRPETAAMLRAQLRRTMADRLGIPADAPVEAVAAAAAARVGADAAAVTAALADVSPVNDAALVQLAQQIESLRTEVTHVG